MKISKLLASEEVKDPDLQLKITAFMSGDIVVSFVINNHLKYSLVQLIIFVYFNIKYMLHFYLRQSWRHKSYLDKSK